MSSSVFSCKWFQWEKCAFYKRVWVLQELQRKRTKTCFFFLKDIDYVNVQKFWLKSLVKRNNITKLQSCSTINKELLELSVQKHNYNTELKNDKRFYELFWCFNMFFRLACQQIIYLVYNYRDFMKTILRSKKERRKRRAFRDWLYQKCYCFHIKTLLI